VWVDTVGWDDAECEDDETFKDILRFIDKYNITKVFLYVPDPPLKRLIKMGFFVNIFERF
jgi:hypothetical protein